jgi:hypothetical protein
MMRWPRAASVTACREQETARRETAPRVRGRDSLGGPSSLSQGDGSARVGETRGSHHDRDKEETAPRASKARGQT